MRLPERASLRHLLHHPAQLILCVAGIGLGVAVVLGLDIAIGSSQRAFELSLEGVTGAATHSITAPSGGIADEVYRELRLAHGEHPMAPVIEEVVTLEDPAGGTFWLVGIDPYAERALRPWRPRGDEPGAPPDFGALVTRPGAVFMAADTAAALGLEAGDPLRLRAAGRIATCTLLGVLAPTSALDAARQERLLVTDIATAQEFLGHLGTIDRIDLRLDERDAAALAAQLPAPLELRSTAARTRTLDEMMRAFELNLQSLSLLALVVGSFLIYNAMIFSVVQRRTLFGRLRAFGLRRREVWGLVLAEALVLGTAGTLVGLAAGLLLARGLVGVIARTISDLYFALEVTDVSVSPWTIAKAAALGIGATFISALVPAREASRATPRLAMARASIEARTRAGATRAVVVAVLLLVAGAGLLAVPTKSLVLGYVAMLSLLLGYALLVPGAVLLASALLRALGRALRLGMLWQLAAGNLAAHLSRTGIAIAALAIAVSMATGVGIMIGSFRGTVVDWLDATLVADVYVSTPGPVARKGSTTPLPPALVRAVRAFPEVVDLHTNRWLEVVTSRGRQRLVALDLVRLERSGLGLREGDFESAWQRASAGDGVLVSEPFAFRHGLGEGDPIVLHTPRGEGTFRIEGVFFDYASDEGYIALPRATYERYWNDDAITALALFLADPQAAGAVSERIEARAGPDRELRANPSANVRRATLEIFDRTFTITVVIRILATMVAVFGIFSALLALLIERAREVAVLRAAGLTPSEVARLVFLETGLLGAVAGVVALPLGVLLAAILTVVVNRRSFGWSIDLTVDGGVLLEGVAIAVVAALLAGIIPAWRMARLPVSQALRSE